MRAHLWRDLMPATLVIVGLALAPFVVFEAQGLSIAKTGIILSVNWALCLLSIWSVLLISQPMIVELKGETLEFRTLLRRRAIALNSVRLHGYCTSNKSRFFLYSPGFLLCIPIISENRRRLAETLNGVLPADVVQIDVVPSVSHSYRLRWKVYRGLSVFFLPLVFAPTIALGTVVCMAALEEPWSAVLTNTNLLIGCSWLVTAGLAASVLFEVVAQAMEWGLGGSCTDLPWLLKHVSLHHSGYRNRVRAYMLASVLILPGCNLTAWHRERFLELLASDNPGVLVPLLGACSRIADANSIAIIEKHAASDDGSVREVAQRVLLDLRARVG